VAKKMTKEQAEMVEMLTIPTFLNRTINEKVTSVGFQNVDGILYKVDAEGNLYNSKTNKLKGRKDTK
jgi:hypothetical protein